ncbi:MAG TPA: AlpA family phage regulatory protein [Vicinamibacterales bacterium]|nr:AlpA family phage regulatory protein [Vicinamibacterales bacterium]
MRDRALAMADVCAIVTVSEATLWRMRRRHEFPTPIQISPGRIGWLRSTVDQWLATRAPAA